MAAKRTTVWNILLDADDADREDMENENRALASQVFKPSKNERDPTINGIPAKEKIDFARGEELCDHVKPSWEKIELISTKELWESHDYKYKSEDAGANLCQVQELHQPLKARLEEPLESYIFLYMWRSSRWWRGVMSKCPRDFSSFLALSALKLTAPESAPCTWDLACILVSCLLRRGGQIMSGVLPSDSLPMKLESYHWAGSSHRSGLHIEAGLTSGRSPWGRSYPGACLPIETGLTMGQVSMGQGSKLQVPRGLDGTQYELTFGSTPGDLMVPKARARPLGVWMVPGGTSSLTRPLRVLMVPSTSELGSTSRGLMVPGARAQLGSTLRVWMVPSARARLTRPLGF
ncbi:hypothetical protein DH2020_021552 [Rehmannia glutinosa]|uniref:Uncharacterized protein n=1 Tax=Rehmannia glutinosa TaxID=99300 RepID=A0ABR0WEM0_REHGL